MSLGRCANLVLLLALAGCAHFEERKLNPEKNLADFENRSLLNNRLQTFLATNRAEGQIVPRQVQAPEKWDLENLTLVAFYYHPSLDVARAQWNSVVAGIRTAGARPNPTIGLLPGYDFNAASGVSPWIPILNFDWPIETAGKRARRLARAEQLSVAARMNILSAAWLVRSNLRASLVDLIAAQQRQAALEAQLKSGESILQLMEQRLAAGAAASTELFPARVTVLRARSDLVDLKRQIADARSRLAESLGLPLKGIEGAQLDFSMALPTNWVEMSSAEVRHQALLSRPDLLAALAEYQATQSALQLEIAKQYPDVRIANTYQWDQGDNKWNLGVTLDLPVLNRNEGPIAEAEAKRTEASARFGAVQAKAIAEIDRAISSRNAVVDQIKEAEKVVETHQQQVTNLDAALKQGGADRLELETASLELRSSELLLLELHIKAQQALGQLENALQRPFDSLRAVERDPKLVGPLNH